MRQFHCPNLEDYLPCCCYQVAYQSSNIMCRLTSIKKVEEAFQRTRPSDIDTLHIYPTFYNALLEKNIFGNKHRFKKIYLTNEDKEKDRFNPEIQLSHLFIYPEIHMEAFASSNTRSFTTEFIIIDQNMELLKFNFLKDFNQLNTLKIVDSKKVHLSDLPELPNLIRISISNSSFKENWWINLPSLIKGILDLYLDYNELDDEAAGWILQWIVMGPSRDTLRCIDLSGNTLTKIPHQLKLFSHLKNIKLQDQNPPGFGFIPKISLPIYSVNTLDVSSTYLTYIEPEAFESW